MAIGLTEEHEALAASVRGLVERHGVDRAARAAVQDGQDGRAGLRRPVFWDALAAQGLLGLHLAEAHGGQGGGLLDQAVVLEELGRALAPGAHLPTVLGSAIIEAGGGKPAAALLPALADGSRTAAVALTGALSGDGGTVGPVLGAPLADLLVLPLDGGDRWVVVDAADVQVEPLESLDLTRPVGQVTVDGLAGADPDWIIEGVDGRALATVLLGAEACGVAARALDDAVAYAKLREQFGRPIGRFQGVKHRCGRMLIDLERARAAVWDAARALSED
ncbi:acyl-CoA dehydrogenase family protein, partial [Spirillospora sp. NPDC049652]